MRLSVEKIKAAILDGDVAVRTAAVYYFVGGHSPDPSLMPLVIQAFERFGDDAFEMFSFLGSLRQTDESIGWICRQLERIDPDDDAAPSDLFDELAETLCRADGMLLERQAAAIRQIDRLDEDYKTAIANRIQLASLAPEALWQKLIEFCEELDQDDEEADQRYDFGCSIVDALARYPERFAGETLKILERGQGEDWLEVMAVRLAGVLRLEAATASLVDHLGDAESWTGDGARRSLIRIGSDAVVKQLAARYTADEDARVEIAYMLEDFHSDFSVQTCLELLGQEQDDELRGILIQSVLWNFATEGIEPARQFVLTHEKTPDVLDVRQGLLLACKMLGTGFPEFDAWVEDSAHDTEFRRAWYTEHGFVEMPEDFDFDDEENWEADEFEDDLGDDLGDDFGGDFDLPPAETIVRHDEKVGRNDPCPCGSGKKYKKCCLHKQALE